MDSEWFIDLRAVHSSTRFRENYLVGVKAERARLGAEMDEGGWRGEVRKATCRRRFRRRNGTRQARRGVFAGCSR